MLKENDLAPAFSLLDSNESRVSLKDFFGKWVVLYFYPKDFTFGCTIEAIDFTKRSPEFSKLRAMILGISKDSCESHMKFVKGKKLSITLLSDPDSAVQKLYGVWQPKKLLGREFLGTVRTTFLVDPEGMIVKIWNKVNPIGHADAVLEEVRKRSEPK